MRRWPTTRCFSLAPLLLLVISIAGLVFGAEAAQGQIVGQLGGLVGHEGAIAIQGLLKSASEPARSTLASLISVITLIIGATSIFAELQSDLDRIWRAPEVAKAAGIWGLLRTRLLSFGLIISIGFLMLISLVVSAALAAVGTWWGSWFGDWTIVLQIVNQVVSFAFITVLSAAPSPTSDPKYSPANTFRRCGQLQARVAWLSGSSTRERASSSPRRHGRRKPWPSCAPLECMT